MYSVRLSRLIHSYSGPLYFGVLLIYIAGGLIEFPLLQFSSKPLLMPILMLWVAYSVPVSRDKKIILSALFFSFLGDCFLLFEPQFSILFILGLTGFLATHILYIYYFLPKKNKGIPTLPRFPLLIIACISYGIIFLTVLYPSLGSLKFPVTVYALVILSMLLAAFYIYTSIPADSGRHYIIGALLFVLSDSLLAFNKFLIPLGPYALAIMITYGFAQWLIVRGFILISWAK